nr:hypothetical protein [Bacteroidota bacterium]
MENSNKDNLTREILCNSKLELKNPDFNSIVMNKILIEAREPKIFHNSVFYIVIFLLMDAFIFVLFTLFNIITIKPSPETGSLVNELVMSLNALTDFILENSIIQYAIVALIALKILSRMTSSGLKIST